MVPFSYLGWKDHSKVINSYGNANECDMCPVREEVRRHRLILALAHAITINEKLAEVCSQGQFLVLFGWENNWCWAISHQLPFLFPEESSCSKEKQTNKKLLPETICWKLSRNQTEVSTPCEVETHNRDLSSCSGNIFQVVIRLKK